jgi:hypothetical protein
LTSAESEAPLDDCDQPLAAKIKDAAANHKIFMISLP